MSGKIIEVNNISFTYKNGDTETIGVGNLTLDVFEGEFLTLLGHNGSGKSTLAKLLTGFILPDNGEISVNGILTTDEEKIYDIRSTVGMVFQNPDNQMVASIIEDDIAFGCENLGVPQEEIVKRVDWALITVNMQDYRTGTPFKLSGGQKQRVAIAAILAMLPKVLILDESTAMLDPEGRREVLDTVKRLNKENNMTVILITHYMDEALGADRVCIMNKGQLAAVGTPEEIFANTKVIKECKLELPVATGICNRLKENGFDLPLSLTDEALVEEICRLK